MYYRDFVLETIGSFYYREFFNVIIWLRTIQLHKTRQQTQICKNWEYLI